MQHKRIALHLLALTALATGAGAQTELTGSLGVRSSSVWRGVTDTNRPIVEGTGVVQTVWRTLDLTAGIWGTAEPKSYDGAGEQSLLGEHTRAGLTQGSVWLDASKPLGNTTATLGATAYIYPDLGELADTYNTVELYGTLAVDAPLAPTLTVFHDVGRIRGAYLEGGVEQELLSRERGQVAIGGGLGWSMAQAAVEGATPQAGYFESNGLTHGEIFVSAGGAAGGITLDGEIHLIVPRDGYARVVAPDRERAAKLWIGMSVGWSASVDRGERP